MAYGAVARFPSRRVGKGIVDVCIAVIAPGANPGGVSPSMSTYLVDKGSGQ